MKKPVLEATPVSQSRRETIKQIVSSIGPDASYEAVATVVAQKKIVIAETTLRQYVYAVRQELGFAKSRNKAQHTDIVSISDLMRARKLVESLGTNPADMKALINQFESFGSLPALKSCLDALEELSLTTPTHKGSF